MAVNDKRWKSFGLKLLGLNLFSRWSFVDHNFIINSIKDNMQRHSIAICAATTILAAAVLQGSDISSTYVGLRLPSSLSQDEDDIDILHNPFTDLDGPFAEFRSIHKSNKYNNI